VARFKQSQIITAALNKGLSLLVEPDTNNPADQFEARIVVNHKWLVEHGDKSQQFVEFIIELVDDLDKQGLTKK
jgi:hypothetical protein